MMRHTATVAVTAAIAFAAIDGGWPGEALAAKTIFECRQKTFPNLPGENSLVLARRGPTAYQLTVQSYDKPKTFRVKCTFHDKDSGAFYCAQGQRRGFFSNRTRELSVTTDGKAQVFEGYTFQAVNAPLGQSRQFMALRFPAASCKVKGR